MWFKTNKEHVTLELKTLTTRQNQDIYTIILMDRKHNKTYKVVTYNERNLSWVPQLD